MGRWQNLREACHLLPYGLFNIISVVAIIVANKAVFKTVNFHFPTALMCIHASVTFLGLSSACFLGFFERKDFNLGPRVIMAVSFILYNVISLANLNVNTVSFYQISKIATTPAVMVLSYFILHKTTTTLEKVAVGIMLAGVTLTTVSELAGSALGFILAGASTLAAAQQQLLIKKLQADLDSTANQLLLSYTPICMVLLAFVGPLDMAFVKPEQGTENIVEWCSKHLDLKAASIIFFSGICGLFVSLSTFLLIAKAGPLTYNIVGHIKTVCIVLSGWLFFGDDMNWKKCLGIALALSGVFMYSYLRLRPKPDDSANEPRADYAKVQTVTATGADSDDDDDPAVAKRDTADV